MNNNSFFKPTLKFKEFMILDLIEKTSNITQREISENIGVAVSMVNAYLADFEQRGYIQKEYLSSKTVKYLITNNGVERRKVLNLTYLNDSLKVYKSAVNNIEIFMDQITEKNMYKIILYGAGDVAEILLQTLSFNKATKITVVAIIDDDLTKQNSFLLNTKIISFEKAIKLKHDGILISSYDNREKIKKKLKINNYNGSSIVDFFENYRY